VPNVARHAEITNAERERDRGLDRDHDRVSCERA
jgi:hypothetical protein